jgi:hypothetical protein
VLHPEQLLAQPLQPPEQFPQYSSQCPQPEQPLQPKPQTLTFAPSQPPQ